MVLLVFVIGGLMAAVGATFLVLGFDIVMTERGAAMTLGGVIALCAGLITIVLGLVALRLTQLLRVFENISGQLSVSQTTLSQDAAAAQPDEPAGVTVSPVGMAAGAAVAAGAVVLGAAVTPQFDVSGTSLPADEADQTGTSQTAHPDQTELDLSLAPSEPQVPTSNSEDPLQDILDELMVDPGSVSPQLKEPVKGDAAPGDVAVEDHTIDSSVEDGPVQGDVLPTSSVKSDDPVVDRHDEPDALLDLVTEPSKPSELIQQAPAEPALAAGPQVLGSYRAGGRTYTMYSDGSVDAATSEGVEKFESMQALREHLAKT